jgi:DNA modification methylase
MGWGGRLISASVNPFIKSYIGIDTNRNLEQPYNEIINFLNDKSNIEVKLYFQDAITVDYSTFFYDMVFTSPPYYNIEQYSHQGNKTIKEWNDWYEKVFTECYKYMQPGGTMAININETIYNNVFVKLFGECDEKIELAKKLRNYSYVEYIYIWIKKH